MRSLRFVTLLGVLLLAGLAAPGCGPAYVDAHYAAVPDMPPDPYDEEVTVAPGDGYTWTSGYWYWDGSHYVWQRGHWAQAPVAGHIWVRSGWVYHGSGYRFVRGYWAPPRHVVRYRYVRPAPRHYPGRPHYRHVPRRR